MFPNSNQGNGTDVKRVLSLDSSFPTFGKSALDVSSDRRHTSLVDRSFAPSSFSIGFLTQSRNPIINNDNFCGDELNYLESSAAYEGPPSQRIYTRIQWKVLLYLITFILFIFI